MKKNILYVDKFKIPLYQGKLLIIVSDKIEQVRRVIPHFNPDEFFAHTYLFEYTVDKIQGEEGYGVIFNLYNEESPMSHGTIAHEAMHAANMIANNRGIVSDFDNDEALCYLLKWIVDCIYYTFSENNLKLLGG